MAEPRACPDCLRRSWLLAPSGAHIERIATGAVGSRSPNCCASRNEDCAAVAAPKVARQLLARVAALAEHALRDELARAGCWACCRHDDALPGRRCATPPTRPGR